MAKESSGEDLSFGRVAVEKGFVTEEILGEALEIQSKLRAMGITPKRIGEILVERAHITKEQAEAVLGVQKQRESERKIPGYEIMSELGRGGMGTVYRALQKSMSREVALKILSPRHARNRKFIDRFFREARAVAKLNHENIIAGIDVGEAGGLYYFAMEYVEGETVLEMINRKGALNEKRAIDIALQVARALEHAHLHSLVHRDIKPQNIIVTRKGVAKLCDLGLAKMEDSEAHITRTGVSMGTPHYISPEQAKGLVDVDIRSDIYSIGATLYHMVVGEVPFVGSSPLVVMTKHLTEVMPFPSDRNPGVSVGLSEVICKMTEKRVEDRYQNPAELIVDLERVSEGLQPAIAGRKHVVAPQHRSGRRRSSSRRAPVSRSAASRPRSRRSGSRERRGRGGGGGRGFGSSGRPGIGGRASSVRTHTHHENVMFGVFVVAAVFMFAFALLMSYVSSGGQVIQRIDFGKYEVEKRHLEASRALGKARYFDRANPYEDKEIVAAKYQEIVSKYPGTEAAQEAAEMIQKVMQRRK